MSDDLADGALIDISGLTLSDLKALSDLGALSDGCDGSGESGLTWALSRILAAHDEAGYHGFQNCI